MIVFRYRHGDGQLKIMYIGGPNQRRDFHIEPGEEVKLYIYSISLILIDLFGCMFFCSFFTWSKAICV